MLILLTTNTITSMRVAQMTIARSHRVMLGQFVNLKIASINSYYVLHSSHGKTDQTESKDDRQQQHEASTEKPCVLHE